MKNRLTGLLLLLLLASVTLSNAQEATPTPVPTPEVKMVSVTQDFVDTATKSFNEVVALREVIVNFKIERAENEALVKNADSLITALRGLTEIKDKTLIAKDQLLAVYQRIIDLQETIILKYEKLLNKPQSTWQKFLKGLKEVAKATSYILIGAGVGRITP